MRPEMDVVFSDRQDFSKSPVLDILSSSELFPLSLPGVNVLGVWWPISLLVFVLML